MEDLRIKCYANQSVVVHEPPKSDADRNIAHSLCRVCHIYEYYNTAVRRQSVEICDRLPLYERLRGHWNVYSDNAIMLNVHINHPQNVVQQFNILFAYAYFYGCDFEPVDYC
ncbi:uncharacterized protein LOC112689036 [Sipha flava]|uniref:Uncharacterized protein LOC112689036 n=1 Tax=Sipha flava TaxID=143950 RepID=A0A8B8G649_9HEMI|nr:uncharacterized protein LOC112689036 [Sipha flava]